MHVDLIVKDIASSIAFYMKALGCEVVEDCIVRGPIVDFYSAGRAESMRLVLLRFAGPRGSINPMIELMGFESLVEGASAAQPGAARPERTDPMTPCIRNITVLVTDLREALESLATIGVRAASSEISVDLPRMGKATIAFIRDPDGNLIELAAPVL